MQIYRAYDDGYWPDPAVCLWFAVYGRRIFCFKEKTWYRGQITSEDSRNPGMAQEIIQESKGMRVVTTYCDPKMEVKTSADIYSARDKFENAGVPMDPSLNDRAVFVHAIHTLLDEKVGPNTPRIQFYARGCPQLIKALPRMKFNERDPAKMADHRMDHWPVAMAYFAMSQIPTTSPRKATILHPWQLPKRDNRISTARLIDRRLLRAMKHR